MNFSIIICSHRPERAKAIRTHFERMFADQLFEFILISDAASLCEGYNRGLAQATGELLIFSHDDIELISPHSVETIRRHLKNFDLIGVGGTTRLIDGNWITAGDPYVYSAIAAQESDDGRCRVIVYGAGPLVVRDIKAIDGCFFACKRAVASAIGFDAQIFDGFHLYDVDFSYRVFRAGYRLAVCRDLPLIHYSKGNYDESYQRYNERFKQKFSGLLDEGQQSPWRYASAVCHHAQLAAAAAPDRITALLAALARSS
jgi:hypothetical protein